MTIMKLFLLTLWLGHYNVQFSGHPEPWGLFLSSRRCKLCEELTHTRKHARTHARTHTHKRSVTWRWLETRISLSQPKHSSHWVLWYPLATDLCCTGSLHASTLGLWVLVSSLVWATIIGASLSLMDFLSNSMFFSISKISCRTCRMERHKDVRSWPNSDL